MSPFLNYLNSNFNSNTTLKYTEKGLQVIASKNIARGDEITLTAPAHDGAWFLMKQGEVRGDVPTRFTVNVNLLKEDPNY
jgi:hypothetical protein